ncbi:MAG: F0F1 ATP synthase subunit B [Fidelibacterota bacterium]|nr:MAG: F0F1 ATP synthase subunit B [Candidatus Neomarinimicrobiota bacterium]
MEQLVRFDPGLIFWTWTTFFIVLAILAWKAWRPMIRALEKREARIHNALEAADKARQESEELTAKVQEDIRQSRQEAQQILANARSAAEKVRIDLEDAAKNKADELITKAHEQIDAEREQALREIRATVVDLSLSLAGKVLERNVTTEDNKKLVEESLRRIGKA